MKIAITGSNSNLGKYLTNYFKKKKQKVVLINKNKKFFLENKNTYNFKKKKIDVLIHLAHNYTNLGKRINYEGSKKLFINAKKNRVKKIIFISSISSHKSAISDYGTTKYLIENYCLKNKIIIIRPGLIFGNKLDKKLNLMFSIIKFIPIIPYFTGKKNFIYAVNIKELTEEIYKIISTKHNFKIFNIFCNKKIYFKDLIDLKHSNKIKIRLPFSLFYFFFVVLSKVIYLKSVDSFLGLLKNRQNYNVPSEKNIFTKKKLI